MTRLNYYLNEGLTVNIYSDFAPLSMEFSIADKGNHVLNGGFIFHGLHDGFGNDGAPTFSVSLSKEVGWSIHT